MAVVTCTFEFVSDQFVIDPAEAEETNPGRYGRALAQWLRASLAPDGEPVIAEDWGWCVMLQRKPFNLSIGCANITDLRMEPLPPPQPVAWSCVVVANGFSIWTRYFWPLLLGGVSPNDEIRAVADRVYTLLGRTPGVWDLEPHEHY